MFECVGFVFTYEHIPKLLVGFKNNFPHKNGNDILTSGIMLHAT